jgi:hypothetical protein
MIGRGAGDLAEDACKVCVEIRFQGEARKAAGVVVSVGEARPRKNTAICCEINQEKGISGCVGM